jgi:hypothetical protein
MIHDLSFIRINAVAKYNRHDAIDDAKEVITSSGGWITDYRMFSNRSICLQFEIEPKDAPRIYPAINRTRLKPVEETKAALEQIADWASHNHSRATKDIRGTFQITLIHDEPDLLIEVPPFEL